MQKIEELKINQKIKELKINAVMFGDFMVSVELGINGHNKEAFKNINEVIDYVNAYVSKDDASKELLLNRISTLQNIDKPEFIICYNTLKPIKLSKDVKKAADDNKLPNAINMISSDDSDVLIQCVIDIVNSCVYHYNETKVNSTVIRIH